MPTASCLTGMQRAVGGPTALERRESRSSFRCRAKDGEKVRPQEGRDIRMRRWPISEGPDSHRLKSKKEGPPPVVSGTPALTSSIASRLPTTARQATVKRTEASVPTHSLASSSTT